MSGFYYSRSVLDARTGERIYASEVMSIEEFNEHPEPHPTLRGGPLPCVEYGQLRPCKGFDRLGACDACRKAGAR